MKNRTQKIIRMTPHLAKAVRKAAFNTEIDQTSYMVGAIEDRLASESNEEIKILLDYHHQQEANESGNEDTSV